MILFYLLLWILPLVNHPFWGRQIGPFSIFEYLGIASLAFAISHAISRQRIPGLVGSWQTRLLWVLYVIALISSLREHIFPNPALTLYTASMLLFPLCMILIDTLERLQWALLSVIGGYAWASAYVIREWQAGSGMSSGYRPGWIVGDANYFATAAIVAIILGFVLMQGDRPRWVKLYCLACTVVTLLGVTLCASRGGFLGLLLASILMVCGTKHRVRNLALLAILILPLAVLLPMSPLHRLLHPNYSATESEQYHEFARAAGYHMIEAHPLAGVGLGEFKAMMPTYLSVQLPEYTLAHNMFIEVAAELGVPALLCFIGVFAATYFGLGRVRKSETAPLVRDAALALQAGIVGLMLAGCFVSAEYQKTTWVGLALAASVLVLARMPHLAEDRAHAEFAEANEVPSAQAVLGAPGPGPKEYLGPAGVRFGRSTTRL